MNNFNFGREWRFVTAETHNKMFGKTDLIKREILFGLQILLSRSEIKNYIALKKIYCTEKPKPRHKTPGSC